MGNQREDLKHVLLAKNGVNQRAEETSLPDGTIRLAENVNIDDSGKQRRRAGRELRLALTGGHSMWSNGSTVLVVDNGDLCSYSPDENTLTVLRAGVGDARLSYASVNQYVYYASATISGKVNLYTVEDTPRWGVADPSGNPNVAVVSGSMPDGQYLVSVSFSDSSLEESGSSVPVVATITSTGSILLTDIPQGDADKINIYCSERNGTQLYRQVQLPMGTTSYTITQLQRGRDLKTVNMEALPTGHIVRYYRGRLYTVIGNYVAVSQPLYYGLYNPAEDYLPQFSSDITMVEPVDDGLYISADRIYFLQGTGPGDFSMTMVDVYPAIPGSSIQLDKSLTVKGASQTSVYWFTEDGAVVGYNGGNVQRLSVEALRGVTASSGASTVLRDGGLDRVVTALADTAPRASFGAVDSAEIEVISTISTLQLL
jgi:hypothetical protein